MQALASQKKLIDYLDVLFRWKRFIIINFIIVFLILVVYVLLIPNDYKATSTIIVLPQNNIGLGSIAGFLGSDNSTLSAGAKLFGLGGTNNEDIILGILNSRGALMRIADRHNLREYYEFEADETEKMLRAFRGDLSFDPNEFGMIEISVINKDPGLAAGIANDFIYVLDSINIKLNTEQARLNRTFIEKRYNKTIIDLKAAEDSLYLFRKKYGIFIIPEQIEAAVRAAAEIESNLAQLELKLFTTEQVSGINSPTYQLLNDQINKLKSKISELKYSEKLSDPSVVLFPFVKTPEISQRYLRNYRDIEIQSKILEVILPLFEHAKFEEQKSIPNVQVLDKASPPEIKYSPKRTFFVGGFSLVFLFFVIVFVFIGETLTVKTQYRNSLEEKNSRFFVKVKNIYRIV